MASTDAPALERFAIASELDATRQRVWQEVASFDGVNRELGPWLRMTPPEGVDASAAFDAALGERGYQPFRSWLLLGGLIPVDYDDVGSFDLDPGRGFSERSKMATLNVWQHDRELQDTERGTLLIDRLAWAPRIGVIAPIARRLVPRLFGWRHRQLRKRFGGRLSAVPASSRA